MLLFLNGYHGNKKYHIRILDVSNFSSIKFLVHISPTDGNIRHWLLLNCAFIIDDVTIIYCFSGFAKLLKKQHFRFLCRFFSKIAQISFFKVEYLENGLADFNDFGLILQDFEQPFR